MYVVRLFGLEMLSAFFFMNCGETLCFPKIKQTTSRKGVKLCELQSKTQSALREGKCVKRKYFFPRKICRKLCGVREA